MRINQSNNTWVTLRQVAIISLLVVVFCQIGMHYIKKNQVIVPPKEYILHTVSSDGTPFYIRMDWDEYRTWASKHQIKIITLDLKPKSETGGQ
tara:strand:+ start:840 stop:1118 length:279 start_codon:yes stop_codon:yes gene_type:complete